MAYDIFNLLGTPAQNAIILDALQKTDFPWEKLESKLQATKGKSKIPVEWADLTAYGAKAATVETPRSSESHDDHDHDAHDHPEEKEESEIGHFHVEEGEDLAHGIAFRERTLGLAWYSGKVTMDISLESDPLLAKEVFLSEGAHMIDFFFMTDQQRTDIFNAFHGSKTKAPAHGHAWFDVGGYNTWVGEAFMGGFVKAYSPFPVTIPFVHPPTAYTTKRIREILTPAPVAPAPTSSPTPTVKKVPTPKSAPKEPVEKTGPITSTNKSRVFHQGHRGYEGWIVYPTREAAIKARKVPCQVCKP